MTHPTDMPVNTNKSQQTAGGGAYAFVRNGFDRANIQDLTAADLESATVYGRNDETIGSISSLKLGSNGKITDAVVDVGGFLGIGAHSVLLPFSQLTVLRETDGGDVRVHLDTTKDKLKAMSNYDK